MQQTPNYELPLYELDDAANLNDGYNNAMNTIDSALQQNKENFEDKFPIQSNDIDNGVITASKMAANAINAVNIVDGAVTSTKLAEKAVTTNAINDGAVTASKIAENAVTTEAINDGAVTASKIAEGVIPAPVDFSDIPNDTITRPMLSGTAFDAAPTEDSNNLVTSNGVYEYVKEEIAGIETTSNSKSKFVNSNVIIVGDSWGVDNQFSVTTAYPSLLCDKLGANLVAKLCVNGTGYVNGGTPNENFLQRLTSWVNTSGNKPSDIDYIIVLGGLNDAATSNNNGANIVHNAMQQFVDYVNNTFSNAQLYIICPPISNRPSYSTNNLNYNMWKVAYETVANFNGSGQYTLIKNSMNALRGTKDTFTDLNHPNNFGQKTLTNWLANNLQGIPNYRYTSYSPSDLSCFDSNGNSVSINDPYFLQYITDTNSVTQLSCGVGTQGGSNLTRVWTIVSPYIYENTGFRITTNGYDLTNSAINMFRIDPTGAKNSSPNPTTSSLEGFIFTAYQPQVPYIAFGTEIVGG